MSSDWPEYTVQQLVDDKIMAKPKDGNHGSIHPKSSDYVDSGVPFIMATDMIENGVDFNNCKYITEEMAASLRKGFAEPGDVLLSHKATIGRTSILQDHSFSTVVLTPQVTYYRVLDEENLNNKYLHYYFKSEKFQSLFNSWAGGGSTRAYLGITDQRKLPITVPPIDIQRDIARVLGDLDQKIHLNQQTNETLEAIAQAIFKSWFVDFDPVRAKMKANEDGRDPNRASMAAIAGVSLEQDWDEVEAALDQKLAHMSEDQQQELSRIAQLFPDELVESEIGVVPKGWGIKPFKEICEDIQSGGTPKRSEPDYWGEGYQWLSSGEIRNRYLLKSEEEITEKGLAESNAKLWPSGSTIIAMYGATAGVTAYLAKEMCANQACCCLIPSGKSTFVFISALRASQELSGKSTGSAQQNLNKGIIESHKVLVPSDEVTETFESIASPLIEKIIANENQNSSLSELRDTLLPKLISGEVGVRGRITSLIE